MATTKRVKRKKLNIKAFIVLLLTLYFIIYFSYTFLTMPIKNIYINNTTLLTDNEIIEAAEIKNYPSIFKISQKSLEKRIATLELVSHVTVKKKLNGSLIINIEEAKPLFYNRNTEKVMLSNNKEVNTSNRYLGIPTLINYVPNELLEKFVLAFKEVDPDIIKMINEIEYNPNISEAIVIDDSRFYLRMNDTNNVYVNILNMKRLNNYKSFFMLIGDARGILYLDSYDSSDDLVGLFTAYDNTNNDNEGGDRNNGED